MRPGDAPEGDRLAAQLMRFERRHGPLPGIQLPENRRVFIEQLVESERRRRYTERLRSLPLSPHRTDPASDLFHPLKAAVVHHRAGRIDEAFWLLFLFVHFGRSKSCGFRYARDVYGAIGSGLWDWIALSSDPGAFGRWLIENANMIRCRCRGGFGNHRKYERLESTAEVVESYVRWVDPARGHGQLFAEVVAAAGDARAAFAALYASMAAVARFGRLGRFDFLTAAGRLGLAAIEPDRPHLEGSTGPLSGARTLFGSSERARVLDARLAHLADELGVGMDVIEDAVCNWHKSPSWFKPFRG